MKALVKRYKENLVIICFPESREIYEYVFPDVEYEIITRSDFIQGRIAGTKLIKMIYRISPKLIYDFTGSVLSATLIFWYRADMTFGFNKREFSSLYDRYLPVKKTPHLMDSFYDVLDLDENNYIREYEFKHSHESSGGILIHPFAGWAAKEWGLEKFISLANSLNTKYVCSIIVPQGSLSDKTLMQIEDSKIPLIQTTSIKDLFNKISKCSVFVSNDSGPLYIASLCGKATFTIYGPTNPVYSIPFGKNHAFVRKIIHCTPTENHQYCFTNAGRKGCHNFECMKTLSDKEVYTQLLPFLEKHVPEKSIA